jgi:hypothetical protein
MTPWPQTPSSVSSISAIAVMESMGLMGGDKVEVLSAGGSSSMVVKINGATVNVNGGSVAFGQGTVSGTTGTTTVLIQLTASMIQVRVQLLYVTASTAALTVNVDLLDGSVACRCSEGLLGYYDNNQQGSEWLSPKASTAYRTSSDLPVTAGEFAAIPSSGTPTLTAFGELWRLSNSQPRVFSSAAGSHAPCSQTAVVPQRPTGSCAQSNEAKTCCASMIGTPQYDDCILDFCASDGVCIGVFKRNACGDVSCPTDNVCVGGECVPAPLPPSTCSGSCNVRENPARIAKLQRIKDVVDTFDQSEP